MGFVPYAVDGSHGHRGRGGSRRQPRRSTEDHRDRRPTVSERLPYALHYGYTDGRGTILRYDNENQTVGRHERHTPEGVTELEFRGMMALRDRFLDDVDHDP